MIIKCNRKDYEVEPGDWILDNGYSYIFMKADPTKQGTTRATISKKLFNQLLSEEKIYKSGNYNGLKYMYIYKFDVF